VRGKASLEGDSSLESGGEEQLMRGCGGGCVLLNLVVTNALPSGSSQLVETWVLVLQEEPGA